VLVHDGVAYAQIQSFHPADIEMDVPPSFSFLRLGLADPFNGDLYRLNFQHFLEGLVKETGDQQKHHD
jgi:hypothetical protein